tara:strand:- start:3039 stop:3158 length:120 start_codon:yes stop_codon:yes gene_type:complete
MFKNQMLIAIHYTHIKKAPKGAFLMISQRLLNLVNQGLG